MPPITLLTDFSADGGYVAQMKGVILGIDPGAVIVDVTHTISPGDIRQGALALDQVMDAFPPETIHVAVVDPGVGGSRALVGVEAGGQRFLAPDNGLLSLVVERSLPTRVHRLSENRYWRNPVSMTFHGRDILAPVAAHWSCGADLAEFGPPAVFANLVRLHVPAPRRDGRSWVGEVVTVDRFGNLITNLPISIIAEAPRHQTSVTIGSPLQRGVAVGAHAIAGIVRGISRYYSEQPAGSLIALFGSSGKLEIAVSGGNAAERLKMGIGVEVRVKLD